MKRPAIFLLALTTILSLFGLLMVYDASSYASFNDFHGNKYHYLLEQTTSFIIGIGGLVFFSFFSYKKLLHFALPLLLVTLFLLVMVFFPGIGLSILGAHRWIHIGIGTIQPTEITKLSMAIYLAAWLSTKEKGRLSAFLLLIGVTIGLIMLEPDMGTAIIILGETLAVYYLSGAPVGQLLMVIPGLAGVGLLLAKLEPYRAARLATFFNPNQDLGNTSYHVRQILIALGTGGFTGVGIGNSLQKYAYLPENTTDSIFAIIGEEFGFLGTTLFLLVCGAFLFVVFRIASLAKDTQARLLVGGIGSFLAMQMIVNLGAQTALIPLTGIPLPFISYGGTSLIVNLCAVGIILNVARSK